MGISLSGHTAVVTGAGRGIGRATACALAGLGAGVVVNDIGSEMDGSGRDASTAERVVAEIEAAGGKAVACTATVAEAAGAEEIIRTAVRQFGGVDILVNNAGLLASGPIDTFDPELFQRVVTTHVMGTFFCTHYAAPYMKKGRWGRIINLVSRAGIVGVPEVAAYGAAKGGIFGFTNVASRELASFGITVNGVNPATTETRMVTSGIDAARQQGGEAAEWAAKMTASMQRPEHVAVLIASLCAEEAAGINGQFIEVSKGRIGLFRPLETEQSFERESDWTADELLEALGQFDLYPLETPYNYGKEKRF
jgi:NAD(P)-dependent dehydrogenase (short-subunit alcohol dehydrogenase family)